MTGPDMGRRMRLAVLWVFVMVNMIYADILSFMRADTLQGFLGGHAEDIVITPAFLLLIAVLTEIPIGMVALSLLLPARVARWSQLAAAAVTVVYVWGGATLAAYYVFFAAIETAACLLIARTAWTWPPATDAADAATEADAPDSPQAPSSTPTPRTSTRPA